jgi:pyrroloquinoline quinone (PQQ) biosynthesis protein C
MAKKPDDFIAELWDYALQVPMREHPWFQGIAKHRWTREQIVIGEVQHYLRVRENPVYFGYRAVNAATERVPGLSEIVLENYLEELAGERSHVDIMFQFLEEGGISRADADNADPAPATLAAIEMILGHCQRRSALEGVAMLAFVEAQHGGYDGAAGIAYPELVGYYGFSEHAAETYKLHAEQDVGHGSRQIELIRKLAIDDDTQDRVRRAVKLGIEAWNLEWDGHIQAITGRREFWAGDRLNMRQVQVRLPQRT